MDALMSRQEPECVKIGQEDYHGIYFSYKNSQKCIQ